MNERREEGADMGVEDKKLHRKTFPAPFYPPCPDFEFLQTSAYAYHAAPDSNSTNFLRQPDWLNRRKRLGPRAEVLKGGILLHPVTL